MKRRLLVAALATVALALTGCSSSHPQGPAGKVTAKDSDRDCITTGTGRNRHETCTYEYELTTRDKAGEEHTFEVSSSDYDDCYRNSSYPRCTKR